MKSLKELPVGKWRKIRLDHISATGTIQKYLDCPLQFWFNKIVKFPDDDKKPWLIFGTAIHAAQEFYLNEMTSGKISRSIESKMFESYDKEMVIGGSKYLPDNFWGDGGLEEQHRKAKVLIKKSVNRYKKLPIRPLIVEEELNVKYDDDLHLTGKIDLVYEALDDFTIDRVLIKKGQVVINDHKTASQKYHFLKPTISSQLTFYAMLYRMFELSQEDYVSFQVFLKYKDPMIMDHISTRDSTDMSNMTELIGRIVQNINNGIFYPTLNHDICKWCAYKSDCKKYSSKVNRDILEEKIASESNIKLIV